MTHSSYFPLRWESTGDQWWYASPIDCAAANGHYDLVRELLYIDTNLLIKLSSLRRIRRLETVWDDQHQFNDVAKCRASVAKCLLLDCETEAGHNSLIRAGYGGWLLYTAASAGDLPFVQDLLERDPLLVFGEGEYGITDVLYAAARSNTPEVFRLVMESAIGMRRFGGGGEAEFCHGFRWEMMTRAVHCAARGGNLEVLKELLVGCCDVLGYRDAHGSTILHSAAGRGQVKVVKDLITSFEIINSTDHQGNTALHIAAYRGFWPVIEAILVASPSLASSTNKEGNTFLHMAVSGFQTPGFRRLDHQLDLVRQIVGCKIINLQDIVNERNNQGRTALHLAVAHNVQFDAVELLMAVPCIDLNMRDSDGMTPLDLLKQHPQCGSSRLLIKQMVSAGGTVSYREEPLARGALAAHLKLQGGLGTSPGTSFGVPDSEIFLYSADAENDNYSDADSVSSAEVLSQCNNCALSGIISTSGSAKRPKSSSSSAVGRLKALLQWPKRSNNGSHDGAPISLRQRYSKNSESPSSSTKKKFTASLSRGVLDQQPKTKSVATSSHSPCSAVSRSPLSSLASPYRTKGDTARDCSIRSPYSSETEKSFGTSGDGKPKVMKSGSQSPFSNKSPMHRYLCFGAQGLAV